MFILRSKGGRLIMRDDVGVPRVVMNEWVLFDTLPANVPPHGDGDVEVKEIVDMQDYQPAAAFVPPQRVNLPVSDDAADEEKKPKKRKPRVR